MMITIDQIAAKQTQFWGRAAIGDPNDCWEWQGARSEKGYGWFCVSRGRHVKAHRAAWMIVNGPIPDGMFICHHCDNPSCINPGHLFLGTPKDNSRDAISKGRKRGRDVLDAEQVRSIRRLAEQGTPTKELADRFGVHRATIDRIKSQRTWTHV